MEDNKIECKKLSDLYPEGSNITILNAIYLKSRKEEVDTGNGVITERYTPDYMFLVYHDNITDHTGHVIIPNPEYTYYVSKPGKDKPYNQLFVPKEDVVPVTCKYSKLAKSVAESTDRLEEYNDYKRNGDYDSIKKLNLDPRVFFSDMNIEDFYRFKFNLKYNNDTFKIHKGFFDIEVDGKDQAGDFPELGECPINALSYYDEKGNTIYTFLLRNHNNPLIEEFEKSINGELYRELYNFIINAVGGPNKADEYGITGVKQQFLFFDEEIQLIRSFFLLVHKLKPHFIEGWNMSAFDTPYIIERIKMLGYDPEPVMCDPTLPRGLQYVNNHVDAAHYNQLNKRSDFTIITGDTVWLDQMLQFASVRSAKYGSFTSFKLDDIGRDVAGVRKLDYSDITTDITKFPYLNYKRFVFYNIMDTIVQKCIEACCKDLEYILATCLVNNTSYAKCHRQTVYLTNRITNELYNKGLIVGNNVNKWNEKPDKYAGAIVTEPALTNDYSKKLINGEPAMIIDNAIDEDFKALYPSTEQECNIAPNTQIGAILMPEKIYDKENILSEDKYVRSGEFIENMVCDNPIEFHKRYMQLAGIKEFLLEDILEFLANNNMDKPIQRYKIDPIIMANSISPIILVNGKINPIISMDLSKDSIKSYSKELRDSL